MNVGQLQDHLHSLEERLFHPDREVDRTVLHALIAPEFREFCASGKILNRQQVIEVMGTVQPKQTMLHHFYVLPLSETSALSTYKTTTASEVTHRSSVWVLRDEHWQLIFHHASLA